MSDVRTREQLAEELTQARADLAALLEHTDDFILVCDHTGSPVLFNEAYRQVMAAAGIKMEPGLKPHTLLPDKEAREWWEGLHQRVLGGEAFRVEYTHDFEGQARRFEFAYNPIRRDGQVVGFTEISRDITARVQTEQALRAEKERAQGYLDVAGVVMVVINADETIALLNRKGGAVLGCDEASVIGKNWFDRFIPPRMREQVRGVFRRLMRGEVKPVEQFENPIFTTSGEERLIAWHNTILRDTDGAITGALSSGTDITEQRRAEQEREALREQLYQAQKMEAVGHLAGGVAHDVNNVLMIIAGLASVLEENLSPQDSLRQDMATILEACDRGQALTRNLLGFARKGKLRTERLSVDTIIVEAVGLLQRTISKGVNMRSVLEADPWEIKGDGGQINHVLVNLALNAADAMDHKGTIVFSSEKTEITPDGAREHPGLEPGPHVRLRVQDTGVGMTPDVVKRAFDPFFTTKEHGAGTGLGLAMVYGTVRNHGGAVRLESAPHQGTTVEILLPALTSPRERPPTVDEDLAQVHPAGRGTVLLVDDEHLVRLTGQRMLERLGFKVLPADSGSAALEIFRERQAEITLVVLDLAMPGMDGAEVFHALRQQDPELRVFISSGYFKEEGADVLMAHGAVGFIQKPYRLKTLAEEIGRGLGEDTD